MKIDTSSYYPKSPLDDDNESPEGSAVESEKIGEGRLFPESEEKKEDHAEEPTEEMVSEEETTKDLRSEPHRHRAFPRQCIYCHLMDSCPAPDACIWDSACIQSLHSRIHAILHKAYLHTHCGRYQPCGPGPAGDSSQACRNRAGSWFEWKKGAFHPVYHHHHSDGRNRAFRLFQARSDVACDVLCRRRRGGACESSH